MITVHAFAKINLALAVRGLREDGFHEIESWVQTIDLSDELLVRVTDEGLAVQNDLDGVSGKDIAQVAAEAILSAKGTKRGASITISKGIPAGAGLGGGSSDAAAVLLALDRLIDPPLESTRIHQLAAAVGSDVPLFLEGGSLTVAGRGEKIANQPPIPGLVFAVVTPPIRCDTRLVYGAWDELSKRAPINAMELEVGRNDLRAAALSVYPELRTYDQTVRSVADRFGAVSGMSGSGSSFFVALDGLEKAREVPEKLRQELPAAAVWCCGPTKTGHRFVGQELGGVER